jgi:glycosyltransferase involved in cell wall biosynthesis
VFPAYIDAAPFLDRRPEPLPERPQALFVGVLERSKNVDGLAEAWRRAAQRLPEDASLRVVGRGRLAHLVEELMQEFPGRVFWTPELEPDQVPKALDAATVLVLPSRTEGLPRVVIEAFARGRGVIGARAGGIPDLVEEGENGLLVDPEDREAFAGAMIQALSNRELAERLSRRSREVADRWISTPEEYAVRVRMLVDRARARRDLH